MFIRIFTALAMLLIAACGNAKTPDTDQNSNRADANGGIGPLTDIVALGQTDGWFGEMLGDTYWMENKSEEGAIRYYFTGNDQSQDGRRTISVDVKISDTGDTAGAGLLYGYVDDPKFYYLILAGRDNQIDIYRRDSDGLSLSISSTASASKTGLIHLEVIERGNDITVHANGRKISSFSSNGTGKGAVGIAALGVGKFGFANYSQTPESANKQGASLGASEQQAASAPAIAQRQTSKVASENPSKANTPGAAFREHTIRDKGRNNAAAYYVLVPKGWEVKGSFDPVPAYHMMPYLGTFTVTAPDGRFSSFTPFVEFGFSDYAQGQKMQAYEGRPYFRMPNSFGQFLIELTELTPQANVSNMEVISEDVLTDATQMLRERTRDAYLAADKYTRDAGYSGERFIHDSEVRRVVMQYTENGKRMESVTFGAIQSNRIFLSDGSIKTAMWSLSDFYSVGGPAGSDYINDPLLATIVRSRRPNQDWSYAIDQWYQGKNQMIVREGMAKIAAAQSNWTNTRAQQSEDALDISFNGWKSRNASSDASQANLVNSIHERTSYVAPSGGTVNLPSYYQNAYTDGQGNYVLHNDANYQINTDPAFNSQNWERVEPAP